MSETLISSNALAAGAQLQARTLGCKAPKELSSAFPEWAGCNVRDPEILKIVSLRARSCRRARWAARRRRSCRARSRSGRAATSSRRTCTPSPSAATSATTPMSGRPPTAPASRCAPNDIRCRQWFEDPGEPELMA